MLEGVKHLQFTKNNVKKLPLTPGIYIFFNIKGVAIYIGKAKSLKNRVSSYLNTNQYGKTQKLIDSIDKFSYIKVESDIEAYILESNFIKKFKPYYNISSKDDKGPYYVFITADVLPRVLVERKRRNKTKYKYIFGPFYQSRKLFYVLKILRSIVPYSTHLPEKRTCLYSQLGLCKPCPSAISDPKTGSNNELLESEYYLNIKKVRYFFNGKFISLKNRLVAEMKAYSNDEKFEKAKEIKERIDFIDSILQKEISEDNYLKDPQIRDKDIQNELTELKNILHKYNIFFDPKKRLECYDISHLQGSHSAGSMVVFIDGESVKKHYRHFRLRRSQNNDVSSLKEIAQRRIKHFFDWGKPGIIIVDGGKAQVNTFLNQFSGQNISVCGIAKRYEKLVIPINGSFIEYKLEGGALKFIQRVRNEAHRFAQRYHKKLLTKDLLKM